MALSKEERAAQKSASRKARTARRRAEGGATPKVPDGEARFFSPNAKVEAESAADRKRRKDREYQAKRRAAAKAAK